MSKTNMEVNRLVSLRKMYTNVF